MRRLLFSLLFLLLMVLSSSLLKSQGSLIKIIDFKVQDRLMHLEYELNSKRPEDILFILWDREFNPVIPKAVSGSIGTAVEPGGVKVVKWDLYKENDLLYSKLKPDVIAINHYKNKKGEEYALLSVVLPGLGDYFVADKRNMKFRPYLRTVTSLGAITLGVVASNKINRPAIYSYYVNPITNAVYKKFSGYGEKQYWLFKYDNAVFFTLGIGIWVYDVIWVAAKGGKNKKINKLLTNFELVPYYNGDFTLRLNVPIK